MNGRHAGETAWIVGKGPSLGSLRASDIGLGPVVALNQATLAVADLGLRNPLYSLQKDGCPTRNCRECRGSRHPVVAVPGHVGVIVQAPGYSEFCLPDHPLRFAVDPLLLGLIREAQAVRIAVEVVKRMGCARIVFACCDAVANGDLRTYDPISRTSTNQCAAMYVHGRADLLSQVAGFPHEFLTPEA